MNARLKELRKNILNLTLKDFGEKISLSPGALGDIESGRRILQDRHIKLICQTFNVNEDWLRNGNEPIFKEKSNDILEEFLKEYKLSEFMSDIVKRYLNLEPEYQQMFEKFVKEMVKDLNVDKNTESEKINSLILKEEPKNDTEVIKIVARGKGVTTISKEEFEKIEKTAIEVDNIDDYF